MSALAVPGGGRSVGCCRALAASEAEPFPGAAVPASGPRPTPSGREHPSCSEAAGTSGTRGSSRGAPVRPAGEAESSETAAVPVVAASSVGTGDSASPITEKGEPVRRSPRNDPTGGDGSSYTQG